MMKIRKAAAQDLEGINHLLYQVLMVHHYGRPDLFKPNVKKYTDAQILEMLKEESRPIFVAVDEDNQVLGYAFCQMQQHPNDNVLTDIKTLYLDDLCVDEKLRGRHIGKQIYEYVLQYARNCGCYNVTLNAWNCNPVAMAFYESCDMKPYKVGMETIL